MGQVILTGVIPLGLALYAWHLRRAGRLGFDPQIFWSLTAGVVIMVSDLTIAGLVEAKLWQSSAPWMESVRAARPYWLIRTLSFLPIAAGFLLLLAGLVTGDRGAGLRRVQEEIGLDPVAEIAPRLATETA